MAQAYEKALEGFQQQTMTFLGRSYDVYIDGQGPAVLIMHEIPGLHPEVSAFGRRVVDAGFTVYMPSLLGTPGKPYNPLYDTTSILRACISREFTVLATRQRSPITDWLRALAKHAHEHCGGKGVGALGMCLTGGFALAMMVDETIQAPVLSQPSLPFPVTGAHKRDLNVDDEMLARIKERAEQGACLMGLRFTGDRLVPPQRFQRLRDELGDNFIAIEIDSSPGNPHDIPRTAHSVLTRDFVDQPGHPTREALDRVLAFFQERLPERESS